MMRHHRPFAETFDEVVRHAFGQASRAHEDQRGPMFADELSEPVIDLAPHLVAGNRPELVARHFDRKIHLATVPDVDDLGASAEEARDLFDRLDGRRQPDPLRLRAALCGHQPVQARKREREMRTALVRHHSVDLVDDHGRNGAQRLTRARGGQKNEQRLRRGDEDVRRVREHPRAVSHRRVARSQSNSYGVERTSLTSALSGETYRIFVSAARPVRASRNKRSTATRNAASVLPEPVGAQMSTSRPDWMRGQPAICGAVGPAKRLANHSSMSGSNEVCTPVLCSRIIERTSFGGAAWISGRRDTGAVPAKSDAGTSRRMAYMTCLAVSRYQWSASRAFPTRSSPSRSRCLS